MCSDIYRRDRIVDIPVWICRNTRVGIRSCSVFQQYNISIHFMLWRWVEHGLYTFDLPVEGWWECIACTVCASLCYHYKRANTYIGLVRVPCNICSHQILDLSQPFGIEPTNFMYKFQLQQYRDFCSITSLENLQPMSVYVWNLAVYVSSVHIWLNNSNGEWLLH